MMGERRNMKKIINVFLSFWLVLSMTVTPKQQIKYHTSVVGQITGNSAIYFNYDLIGHSTDRVNVLIYSGGGYVHFGYMILESILRLQKRGVKFYCYTKRAMSMAATILQFCDRRIGLKNSDYMQHRSYKQNVYTGKIVYDEETAAIDKKRMRIEYRRLKIRRDVFERDYVMKERIFDEKEALRIGYIDEIYSE